MTLVTPFTCWNTACTPQKQPPASTAVSVPFAVARGVSATALGSGVAASDGVHADSAISGSAPRVLGNLRRDKRSMPCPPNVRLTFVALADKILHFQMASLTLRGAKWSGTATMN